MTFRFLLLTLVTYRLTRLVVADDIAEPVRVRLHGRVLSFAACPWCVGFWLSGAVVLGAFLYGDAMVHPLLWWLAISGVVGALSEVVDG